jgi:hypothetical protein
MKKDPAPVFGRTGLRVFVPLPILLILLSHPLAAQRAVYSLDVMAGAQNNFGPSENQAELAGDTTWISYDGRRHYVPGFRYSVPVQLTLSRTVALPQDSGQRRVRMAASVGYSRLDMGLVERVGNMEFPLALLDMMDVRFRGKIQMSNPRKKGDYGIYFGLFAGVSFPLHIAPDATTVQAFGISKISGHVQGCWGIDYDVRLRIGKSGWYASAAVSVVMPGLVGSIAGMETESGGPYELIRSPVRQYSFSGMAGIGRNFGASAH